jgi:hypothetical protein
MSSVVVTLKGRIMEKQVRVVLSARNERWIPLRST